MNTEVKNTIKATDRDAQYDESAKRLLGQKIILAHIDHFFTSNLVNLSV